MNFLNARCAGAASAEVRRGSKFSGDSQMTTVEMDEVATRAPSDGSGARRHPRPRSEYTASSSSPASASISSRASPMAPSPRAVTARNIPEAAMVDNDFALMAEAGVNTVRVFSVPPVWLLDAAHHAGLKVLVGLSWPQHIAFLDSAVTAVRNPRNSGRRGTTTAAVIPPSSAISSATKSPPT